MTPTAEHPRTAPTPVGSAGRKGAGWMLAAAMILWGVGLRFFRITDSSFIFYDEGMWLLQGHELVEAMASGNGPSWQLVDAAFHQSLRTGKALWAFLSMLRGFFVGAEGYYFTRVLSAVLGSATVGLVYIFARRLYASTAVALGSAVLLAMMPTHIFYSRLALQEAFTAFFFLGGMYLYLFGRGISWRAIVAGGLFAAVFFVNYRMIILPLFLGCAELYWSLGRGRRPEWGKALVCVGVFLLLVLGIGALDGAANLKVTFGWMFHQGQLAKGTFSPFNVFSYPYYMMTFEGILFAAAFWANAYFLWRRRWPEAFAFVMVVLFMAVFSLPQEKGVRYLTSALPFMAMAVSVVTCGLYQWAGPTRRRVLISGAVVLMLGAQMWGGWQAAAWSNSYRDAIVDIRAEKPRAKFVSTQSMIQRLYVADKKDVAEFRYHLPYLMFLRSQGYRYLIVGPQAYVSFTPDDLRFQQKLKGFLQFIADHVEPEAEYAHFDGPLLKRFVLEHNEHLGRSLSFLAAAEQADFGKLRVYDLNKALTVINMAVARWQQQ